MFKFRLISELFNPILTKDSKPKRKTFFIYFIYKYTQNKKDKTLQKYFKSLVNHLDLTIAY